MPAYRNPASFVVDGTTFTFNAKTIGHLPDARAFLAALLARGVSPPVASHYTKLVARMVKQGKLDDLDLITHNVERTAANAYRKWKAESYVAIIQPVRRALARFLPAPNALTWVRRHGLVHPFEGKTIPRKGVITEPVWRPITLWDPCAGWTLHIPDKPGEPHTDPCEACTVIALDETLLGIIGTAFKSTWGHADLAAVPPDAFLFGMPPANIGPESDEPKIETTVSLSPATPVSNALSNVRSRVTRDVDSFIAKLGEGADGVYVSREACGDRLQDVLTAVWNAWRPS